MNSEIFSVYDTKAERFLEPFHAPTTAFALREFATAVNTEGHQFNIFPEDYTLFRLGSFDATEGKLNAEATPVSIALAGTVLKPSGLEAITDA
jgi:hypothetical protein